VRCEDENALTDLDCDVNIIVDGMHGGASVLHTRRVFPAVHGRARRRHRQPPADGGAHAACSDAVVHVGLTATRTGGALTLRTVVHALSTACATH
jgi:hypothetical protein